MGIKNFNEYNDYFKLDLEYDEDLFTTYNVLYMIKLMLKTINGDLKNELSYNVICKNGEFEYGILPEDIKYPSIDVILEQENIKNKNHAKAQRTGEPKALTGGKGIELMQNKIRGNSDERHVISQQEKEKSGVGLSTWDLYRLNSSSSATNNVIISGLILCWCSRASVLRWIISGR